MKKINKMILAVCLVVGLGTGIQASEKLSTLEGLDADKFKELFYYTVSSYNMRANELNKSIEEYNTLAEINEKEVVLDEKILDWMNKKSSVGYGRYNRLRSQYQKLKKDLQSVYDVIKPIQQRLLSCKREIEANVRSSDGVIINIGAKLENTLNGIRSDIKVDIQDAIKKLGADSFFNNEKNLSRFFVDRATLKEEISWVADDMAKAEQKADDQLLNRELQRYNWGYDKVRRPGQSKPQDIEEDIM